MNGRLFVFLLTGMLACWLGMGQASLYAQGYLSEFPALRSPFAKPVEELPPADAPADGAIPGEGVPVAGEPAPAVEVLPPVADGQIILDPPAIVAEPPPPPPRLWSGAFDLGLNGTDGNSRLFNFRFGAQFERKTDAMIFTLKANYIRSNTGSLKTANRLFFDGRNEWLLGQSPWTIYVHETTEYDEFRAFDVRVTGDAGIGYRFLANDITNLTGRFGPGFSREFGGPDNSWIPELVFGMAFSHQLSKRQKLSLTVDYFPNATDYEDFRLNTQASWELLLDEFYNLSLKLAVIDRYDSTPHGAKPNDIDYSATVLWKY